MANIFTNLIANTSPAVPGACVGRAESRVKNYLQRMEASMKSKLSAVNTAADEVSVIAQHEDGVDGGTYTLTVNATVNSITYTTGDIAWNADAATIETALDAASPATVGDGDIAVTESAAAGMSDGTGTFTCSGNLAAVPVLISITSSLTDGGVDEDAGVVTRYPPGRQNRNGHQAITNLNIAVGCTHNAGEAAALTTASAKYVGWSGRAPLDVIKWLGDVITKEEGTNYTKLQLEALYPELLNLA